MLVSRYQRLFMRAWVAIRSVTRRGSSRHALGISTQRPRQTVWKMNFSVILFLTTHSLPPSLYDLYWIACKLTSWNERYRAREKWPLSQAHGYTEVADFHCAEKNERKTRVCERGEFYFTHTRKHRERQYFITDFAITSSVRYADEIREIRAVENWERLLTYA